MKRFVSIITAITLSLLSMSDFILAYAKNAEDNTDLYMEQVETFMEELKQSEEDEMFYSSQLEKAETVERSFIICHVGSESQDKVYYYPVSDENGTILFLVEAVIIDDVAQCNITNNLVEVLNFVEYAKNEVLVYKYDNVIYVETPNEVINTVNYYNNKSVAYACSEEIGWDVSFEEKSYRVDIAENNMVEFTPCTSMSENELLDTKMYGSLTLSNPMGQYNYGMCWACAVATVHNYLTSPVVSGIEVCTRMGIGFNSGGTIYDEQDALAMYNIFYNIRSSDMTWNELKKNIDDGYPIIANGFSSDSYYPVIGHAVTICGYSVDTSSTKIVEIWDSSLNGGTGDYSSFNLRDRCFTASGMVYYWDTSLSYE